MSQLRGGIKTVRETKLGDLVLRLVEKDKLFIGIVVGNPSIRFEGVDADEVWRRLHDEANKANPQYFGFDGARARFLRFFPGGFHSQAFAKSERDYKAWAKNKLDATVPLEKAATGRGFGKAILLVFQATNLLSVFEKVRLEEVLNGPNADTFVRSAASFALGDTKSALLDMERVLRPHDSAKWTVATYLPFLWRPQQHMFLKPEVTNDFAVRVGHRFAKDYEPALRTDVYESLLDLVQKTETELADLKPRDRIDVQSFIWVIGHYKDDREAGGP
jgi:hypothetical protein